MTCARLAHACMRASELLYAVFTMAEGCMAEVRGSRSMHCAHADILTV
jgi:hypothetical protein